MNFGKDVAQYRWPRLTTHRPQEAWLWIQAHALLTVDRKGLNLLNFLWHLLDWQYPEEVRRWTLPWALPQGKSQEQQPLTGITAGQGDTVQEGPRLGIHCNTGHLSPELVVGICV